MIDLRTSVSGADNSLLLLAACGYSSAFRYDFHHHIAEQHGRKSESELGFRW